MIDSEDKFPRGAYIYSMLFAILNSTLNPIFYALTNPRYQRGFVDVFSLMSCGKIRPLVKQSNDQNSSTRNRNAETTRAVKQTKTTTNLKTDAIEINVIHTE